MRRFRLHLTASDAGPPKITATIAALRFSFKVTLNRPDLTKQLYASQAPVVLSSHEVRGFWRRRRHQVRAGAECRKWRCCVFSRWSGRTSLIRLQRRMLSQRPLCDAFPCAARTFPLRHHPLRGRATRAFSQQMRRRCVVGKGAAVDLARLSASQRPRYAGRLGPLRSLLHDGALIR